MLKTDRRTALHALAAVGDANDAIQAAKKRLAESVQAARELGISWDTIGTELGVSRQAAQERFGRT